MSKQAKLFENDIGNEVIDYNLHKIVSKSDDLGGWEMTAREKREICILMYFGQLMNDEIMSLSHWKLPMFEYVSLLNK